MLTVISYDRNIDSENQPKININDKSKSRDLQRAVGRSVAEFITFCQNGGKKFTHPSELLRMSYTATTSSSSSGRSRWSRGRRSRGPSRTNKETRESPVRSAGDLAKVLDKLTTSSSKVTWGAPVNINTASVETLTAILGADNADLADRIVSMRADLTPEEKATTAWLYGNDLVSAEQFKKVAPLLTARGFQYRIQVVGYGVNSGRYCVLEAIVDMASSTPRIMYLRDLTKLGVPFPLDPLQERASE